ncbi:hypothetical protein [Winogradskyella aurantiaca]|uniref:hypothetical protein n=1 Tax=Winogradskyella aurantiaca TaxID=2219558 RepID=UPI000E1DA50E|nr:hypothetical protein [Winogradskyella aurantiaca]
MKSILTLLLILTIGFSTDAQNQNRKKSMLKTGRPILIINDTVIASAEMLNKISSNKISELNIFKDQKLGTTNLFIERGKNTGIIKITVNQEIEIKTQRELNDFFGLAENNDIYVNGYLIENKNQNISSESIVEIELIKADDFRLKKPVLNIEIE